MKFRTTTSAKLSKFVALFSTSTLLLFSFQNCSGGFSAVNTSQAISNASVSGPSAGSTTGTTGGSTTGGNPTGNATYKRQWPDTTSGIHIFHDQVDLAAFDSAQIQFVATHYAGVQKVTANDAAKLRSINPNFLILHYRLGYGLGYQTANSNCTPSGNYISIIDGNNWVQEWPGNSVVQPQWFFTYNGSSRVYFCNNGWYVMNISDPSYQTWWLNQVKSQLVANNDDGIFMDSFSIPNFFGSTNYSPNLPAVDSTFEDQWASWMQNWLVYLKANLPGYYLVPNVGSWITGRDHPDIITPADGIMVEQFAMPNNTSFYAESDWQLEMNRILAVVARNQAVIGQTYVTTAKNRMFTVGSYLLIKGTRTYISINNSMGNRVGVNGSTGPEWYPEYNIPIGAPTENAGSSIQNLFDSSLGVYRRNFTNGFVLVNPSTSTITVPLGGTYYLAQTSPDGLLTVDANGNESGTLTYSAVSSVTLTDHSAAVLFTALP